MFNTENTNTLLLKHPEEMFVTCLHVLCLPVVSVFSFSITNYKVADYFHKQFSWIIIIPYIMTHIQQKHNKKNGTFSHWQLNLPEMIPHFVPKQRKSPFNAQLKIKINLLSTSASRSVPSTIICGEALTSRFLLSHVVCSREEPAMVTMASTTLWVTS